MQFSKAKHFVRRPTPEGAYEWVDRDNLVTSDHTLCYPPPEMMGGSHPADLEAATIREKVAPDDILHPPSWRYPGPDHRGGKNQHIQSPTLILPFQDSDLDDVVILICEAYLNNWYKVHPLDKQLAGHADWQQLYPNKNLTFFPVKNFVTLLSQTLMHEARRASFSCSNTTFNTGVLTLSDTYVLQFLHTAYYLLDDHYSAENPTAGWYHVMSDLPMQKTI